MERDDEQLIRHSTREVGKYLSLLRDELRGCGLPDTIVDPIVISQYHQIQAAGIASEVSSMLEKFSASLQMLPSDGEDEDE